MLLLFDDHIEWQIFGKQFQSHPLVVVAFVSELDNSRCSAHFFFEFVAVCWRMTIGCSPENFIIIDDKPCLIQTRKPH